MSNGKKITWRDKAPKTDEDIENKPIIIEQTKTETKQSFTTLAIKRALVKSLEKSIADEQAQITAINDEIAEIEEALSIPK